MSDSCDATNPLPRTVSATQYNAVAITSEVYYDPAMNCKLVLYSGSQSQSIRLQFYSFSIQPG
jgi:hypothetical protein